MDSSLANIERMYTTLITVIAQNSLLIIVYFKKHDNAFREKSIKLEHQLSWNLRENSADLNVVLGLYIEKDLIDWLNG